jgi:hypothetical protein
MADTITDVTLTGDEFQDIYNATSITVGTSIAIQNKTTSMLLVQLQADQPEDDSTDGILIDDDVSVPYIVDSNENGCWVKGVGPINIQEL